MKQRRTSLTQFFTQMKTLVLASNGLPIGQLAADLMIRHCDSKVPFLSDLLIPMLSNLDGLNTAADLFAGADFQVLQIRSLVVEGKWAEFAQKLAVWIQNQQFNQVVILASVFGKTSKIELLSSKELPVKDAWNLIQVDDQDFDSWPVGAGFSRFLVRQLYLRG